MGGGCLSALDAWVRQLAAVVLLAGITETLLPTGTIRNYARALLSLLVLLVVLQPVMRIATGHTTLEIPGLGAPAGDGASASGSGAIAAESAAAGQGVARAYEDLVASAAQRLAAGVPGVTAAQVQLRFAAPGESSTPRCLGAEVWVTPTAAAAFDPRLAAAVRLAVAAGLGIGLAQVQVTVA